MNEPNREEIMKALECHADTTRACAEECPYAHESTDDILCGEALARDALDLLKEQEKQLKEWEKNVPFLAAHGILTEGKICEKANKDSSGCLGYGHSESDDEPIEKCQKCPEYSGRDMEEDDA